MIEIKKITDVELAKKVCTSHGVDWKPDYHVIATIDGDENLQCAAFSYKEEVGEIHAIHGFDDNIDFLDGLCRAILNIMDINGVKDVYLSKKHQEIATHVGFKPDEERYHLTLEGFFQCECCKNNKGAM